MSAVGDHGTWIIVNTNLAGKPNWWLSVHPWDSNDFEERGNFPNREAAQAHAQEVTWTSADTTTHTSPAVAHESGVRPCSSSHMETGPRSRIRQCGPGCGA